MQCICVCVGGGGGGACVFVHEIIYCSPSTSCMTNDIAGDTYLVGN